MKFGVSSYSYIRLVKSGQMGQLEIIAKTKALGFDVIEFSTLTLPPGETPLTFAPKVRAECDRVGIAVANYTIGADFLNEPGRDWQGVAERLKDEVRVAKILGAPGMRHDATRGFPPGHKGRRSFDDALPTLAKGCRAVTEFAADLGIKTMVENHGFFCQDSERIEKLINAVDHPNFGALIDMGNFLCADEEPGRAVGRLMPYVSHVHTKDFNVKPGTAPEPGEGWFQTRGGNHLKGTIVGHGEVPILSCLKIMKQANYDGVLSIEFEGLEEPVQALEIGLQNLRRYVRQVWA
ncbi:MAG: sugar phosphate isomerase/epimerase [Opitutae bacterium]|nr:sugar phosphate isomerase/epimerase [Opitutae bacterium]